MPILVNIATLATCQARGGQDSIGAIDNAALVWASERIRWVGRAADLPPEFAGETRVDAKGRLVIPGLVDCHTHLAFAGSRAREIAARLAGASYIDIARAGGGIQRTVDDTRAASGADLAAHARAHLWAMAALGVTTVECKSGYGLDVDTELRLLDVYRQLSAEGPLRLVPTCLAAHVVPRESRHDRPAYVRLITDRLLPVVAERGLAQFCDAFVEDSAFTVDEARTVLTCARTLGLGAKLHADQLSDGGGAVLAAEIGAVSADHLEHVSAEGIAKLAVAGVTAVSLPLAALYLRQHPAPARQLIEAGVPVAVATDFNPGTAPTHHLPLALLLACTMQHMTADEALKGATLFAARAIGLEQEIGSLEEGKSADFAIIDAPDHLEWLYHFRPNACLATYVRGRCVFGGTSPLG
ncbi:MAG: imidazolonepropionase [Luteitalea sp.]|nr:imidazolonepropionase [Luteitalea sp.]